MFFVDLYFLKEKSYWETGFRYREPVVSGVFHWFMFLFLEMPGPKLPVICLKFVYWKPRSASNPSHGSLAFLSGAT